MNFPEEPETVRENVREIAPEGILYNSRLWDAVVGTVQVRMNEATWLNRKLYEWFLPIGYRYADRRMTGEGINLGSNWPISWAICSFSAPCATSWGCRACGPPIHAGAALSPDAMRFFHALGVNLKQIYGSTEVTGGATIHRDGTSNSPAWARQRQR
jgi:long-chain acyl-CoA synthetase